MPASNGRKFRLLHTRFTQRAAFAALATGGALLAGCDVFDDARSGATSIFDVFAQPTPSEAAQMAMDPYDADKRYRGTMLLSNAYFAGDPLYTRLFVDAAKDPDASVRIAGVRALANHGDSSHVPLLVERLQDKEPLVRLEAARGLQRLHGDEAVVPLMNASSDPDFVRGNQGSEENPDIRTAAANALGQYRKTEVVQHLISIMNDPSLSVNNASLSSLRTLTGQDLGFERKQWLEWFDETKEPFSAGTPYIYPVFYRDKTFWEYFPFVPPPPNEVASTPAGMPPMAGGTLVPVADSPKEREPGMPAPSENKKN